MTISNIFLLSLTLVQFVTGSEENFESMISATTGKNPKEFIKYGNWCGEGGTGDVLDEIDACCKVQDDCYGKSETNNGCPAMSPYFVAYAWEASGEVITCSTKNDKCGSANCACDKTAAECIGKNKDKYNEDNYFGDDYYYYK